MRLYEQLQLAGAEHGVFSGAVEQMGVGAIILDRSGNVVRTNAVADRLLSSGDGLAIVHQKLWLRDATHRKMLRSSLESLGSSPCPCRFRIERLSGVDLTAVARPVSKSTIMHGGAAMAFFVSEPGREAELDPHAVRDLFQLTPMEANLAAALANGRPLVDAADSLGIAHNTARAHLRSIFAKTGVRRQSQLVHLLRTVH